MNTKRSKNIIVCGTDTDVGKTVVSALLVQGLNATYWKPIQSGLDGGGDRGRVCELLKLPEGRWLPETFNLKAPVSPHWAAEMEDSLIKPELIVLPNNTQPIVVETAGGLMVPLTYDFLQIKLIEQWKSPVILVARSGLGTLNHTLLSLEALHLRKIPVLGIILNGPHHPNNPKTLEKIGKIPVIAELPQLKPLNAENLSKQWHKQNLRSKFNELLKGENE